MEPPPAPGKGRVGEGGDCRVQTLATISHAHAGRVVVSDFYNCTAYAIKNTVNRVISHYKKSAVRRKTKYQWYNL